MNSHRVDGPFFLNASTGHKIPSSFLAGELIMQKLDLECANSKILLDIQRHIAEVRRITEGSPNSVEEGVGVLGALRKSTYEEINQIQHEYAAFRAVNWLITHRLGLESVTWFWNPRQTGDHTEPDIRAILDGKVLISCEVTTSPKPIGVLDGRMAKTLSKLNEMEGQKFYFVLTAEMTKRARTKVIKSGYVIDVIHLT